MTGRTIAIGDIHGCATALEALIDEIQPGNSDTLVTLGDYVDRGIDSARVLEICLDLVATCNLIPIIGNHELMMLRAFESQQEYGFWQQYGGSATLASYGGDVNLIPQHHLVFLRHCQPYHEDENFIYVHANYDPDCPMSEQPDRLLFWEHITDEVPDVHLSGKTVICGHTPQQSGDVRDLGHVKIIDTFCYGDQWLTALDVNSGFIWQANNNGIVRESSLEQ